MPKPTQSGPGLFGSESFDPVWKPELRESFKIDRATAEKIALEARSLGPLPANYHIAQTRRDLEKIEKRLRKGGTLYFDPETSGTYAAPRKNDATNWRRSVLTL